ncbi:hypothetical protein CFC21_059969 [Triticum aestivum]|uniref:DUF295 domain-containing protein n=2 Tax=Triticum aestivum TaxID=4565 RepID=A0A9R1GRB6_WHEAT|nr:hypothetical protein CFC21_059969 [Triticum aestivum]
MMMASVSAWSDLPRELLRIIIAGLPDPIDHARFRAVCRSWLSVPYPIKLPIVVHPTGFLLRPFGSGPHDIFPLPENERVIGSTDGFLARHLTDVDRNRHTYTLLNPFSRTLVELPELDTLIGDVSESFRIHKVLMQSGLDGLVAIRTNNQNHPIILLKRGKGVWLPKPRHQPFTRIIDVAFLRDTLYAITQAENLISFRVTFDSKGIPTVTSIKRVITGPIGNVEKDKDALRKRTGDYIINDGMHFADDVERPHVVVVTIWYLVESQGKLLMVRREMQRPCGHEEGFTRKVEVFEADISASTWVAVSSGLHGRALFLSKRSSKSCFAGGEIEEDAIYFIDNGEVFNMRSKIISPADKSFGFSAMWVFLPGSF